MKSYFLIVPYYRIGAGCQECFLDMNAKQILIIDDDVHIGNMLKEALTQERYAVLRAYSGTEALLLLKEYRPDLILLDLMLPGMNGEEILPKLRGIPVIIVSAKAGVDDKVNLLLGGAVDYITKPFALSELLARITVALRAAQNSQNTNVSELLNYQEIRINLTDFTVSVSGESLKLTKTEFAILKILMENPQRVYAKSVILDRLSGETPDCVESSLKVHISNLRQKLKAVQGKDYIETVWGIGFKMKES